ncbi:voltage-gated purine nucleotide uniporter SLC17A9-like [Ptychodera flava]|uniref:voltage-gated purine nucleotide uniporter SLC17A9-like n=1 Tax=Ptychodera flava TaxID=63121 RepID=UPI00396A48F8
MLLERKRKMDVDVCLVFSLNAELLLPKCRACFAVAMGTELGWDKAETGLVLSSFFWGYSLTQIPAGYISDVIGGDQVITLAAIGWGSLTLAMPYLCHTFSDKSVQMTALVLQRTVFGTLQALHYPAIISLISQKVPTEGKSTVYGIMVSGSPTGVVLCGSIGSYLIHKYHWESVFYFLGISSILWAFLMRHFLMEKTCNTSNVKKSAIDLFRRKPSSSSRRIPWKLWFKHKAFWAMLMAFFCNGYSFFLVFSWMPTYFEDKFPGEKGWVFNVVPWLVSGPSRITMGFIADKLIRKYSVTTARKIIQGLYGLGTTVCLMLFPFVESYTSALLVITGILFFDGFNSSGASINPQDLAPNWAGFVYGFANTAGALPGFIGVYISGHILQFTGSWTAVFTSTAVINALGSVMFVFCGSGEPIY